MNITLIIVLYFIVLLLMKKRYIFALPTISVYKNNERESLEVCKERKRINNKDIHFFYLTDPSVSFAFKDYTDKTLEELNSIIQRVNPIIIFFKYSINRARPYQLNSKYCPLKSKTGDTPAYPAGHAFQAYYLAKILSKENPDMKEKYEEIAENCDKVRVKAGIHYPSDGEFSKLLVDIFFS
jgi:hypothetical protein